MEGLDKRYGGPDRIIGVDEKTEAYLKLVKAGQILENQDLSLFEREKTPEEIELMSEIFKKFPDFIKEYGAEQERFTSWNQVHILDDANPQIEEVKSFLERNTAGRYLPSSGRIEILPKGSDHMHMAHVLVHELMHANSFFSITLSRDSEGTEQNPLASARRFGISTNEKGHTEESLFNFINEAVTEEMTKRFCERHFPDIDLLKEQFAAINRKQKSIELPDTPIASVLGELVDPKSIYAYVNERAGFVALIELLYERNKDKFDLYEDVFKLFSTAMFKGDLLPIARLIEDTFGKGTFRAIGKNTKDKSPNVVDTLSSLVSDIETKKYSD